VDLSYLAYQVHPVPGNILKAMWDEGSLRVIFLAECTENNWKALYRAKCYVPDGDEFRLQLIQELHHTALAGDPGMAKTYDRFEWQYKWKDIGNQVH